MEVGDAIEVRQVEVVQGERTVGPDAVPRRPVPVRTDRDHRRRGLLVGLLYDSPDLDALASEHVQQARREGVGPDRAEAAHLGAEPAQYDRRAPAVPAGENRMVSTS